VIEGWGISCCAPAETVCTIARNATKKAVADFMVENDVLLSSVRVLLVFDLKTPWEQQPKTGHLGQSRPTLSLIMTAASE